VVERSAVSHLPAKGTENRLSQILLVDDNPVQLTIREAVLRNAGFQVSVATTPESALAMLRVLPHHIGAMVTDHLMPGCTGADLVRQIRSFNPSLPVIVLSGLAEAESEYQDLNVIFRLKPLAPPELIELLRSRVDSSGDRRGAA
jgi:CheY-like chemotaxis protein